MATGIEAIIFRGLCQHLDDGTYTGTPTIAYPDVKFTPPSTPATWLRVQHQPNVTQQITLGDSGQNRHMGLLQVDVMAPEGKGSEDALETCAEIIARFKRGTTFTEGGIIIRIIAPPSVAAPLPGDAYSQYPVTILYQADTSNPA